MVLLLSSCDAFADVSYGFKEMEYTQTQMDKIVACFDNNDVEGLKMMFCPKKQRDKTLEEQIKTAYELYEGKSKTYSYDNTSMMGGGKRNGKWVNRNYSPLIKDIQTDKGKEYSISYSEYTVYEYDNSVVGILYVYLLDSNGDILSEIG
jgi:hypothetical protein